MNFLTVFAHEGEEVLENVAPSLGDIIRANSIKFTVIASILLVILLVLSHFFKERNATLKKILFWAIIFVIVVNTLYLSLSTIYLNISSKSGGPVHHHADFEIYNCGQQVEVKKSEGLSNKVGSELVHTHNDKRMHIEGVILDPHQLSIGHFFENLGGELNNGILVVPTEKGQLSLKDRGFCPDGSKAVLQVFVYSTHDKFFEQKKLIDFEDYQISPFTQVPPGDCVILEFGPPKLRTDKLCESYQIKKNRNQLIER